MRRWFLWGLIVCCAGWGRSSWAQGGCSIDPVERTARELGRCFARQGGALRATDGPAGRSFDVGDVVVLEDDGAGELLYRTRNGDPTIDVVAVARRFYREHPDDFDFLAVFTAIPIVDPVTEAPFSSYALVTNNDIRGIHMANFDYSGDFGSAGNLEAIQNMNNFADPRYLRDPYDRLPGNNDSTLSLLAHETGHRWGARVQVDDDPGPRVHRSDILLGRQLSHWSFYLHTPTLMGSSSLEGNYWQFNGDGTFSSVAQTDGYCALDQYLMGLLAPEQVPPFFVVDGPLGFSAAEQPTAGVRLAGMPRWFTTRDIVAVEGRRFPGVRSAAGAWRQAFVLVVPKGFADAQPDDFQQLVDRLNSLRREWEYYFFESTEGRGTIHTSLHNAPGPLYRLYLPGRKVHFYTASDEEFFAAVAYLGYVPEGTAGELFPTQAAGTVPVYRLFQPVFAQHFYTSDPYEWEGAILRDGYVPEGVTGYVYPTRMPGTIPLYRLYHYGVADHLYTTDRGEVEQAVRGGYAEEGVLGYVLPDSPVRGVDPR